MALQIQDLVASIRKDGVEAARKDADRLIQEAKAEADRIVNQAKADAQELKQQAERDIALRDASAKASLAQAGRDVVLSLKKALSEQLDRILGARLDKALSGKELADLITSVVKSGLVDGSKTEVQVNKEACQTLSAELAKTLSDEMKSGLVVKPISGVDAGFRLADKDGSGFYDFSSEEIASMLKPFLGDALSAIVFAEK